MADGDSSKGGRLSLGERVHKLEHGIAQTKKELKRVRSEGLGSDDDLTDWIGREVVLVPAAAGRGEDTGILKKVRRYTLLVDVDGALEVFNKGQVLKVRLRG